MKRNFYIDDLSTGVETIEEIRTLKKKITKELRFLFKKIAIKLSNNRDDFKDEGLTCII